MSLSSRRQFLFNSAGAAVVVPALLAAGARAAAADAPAKTSFVSNHEPPGALHVFSKPFGRMDFHQMADIVAESGFQGIDYLVRSGGHIEPERAVKDLPRAVEIARAAGLKVEMITTGIKSASEPLARDILTCAASLGIKAYRVGSFQYDMKTGVLATLEALKPVVAGLAELNRQAGIHGALQNLAGKLRVGGAGWDLYELLRDQDPRWMGCQHDVRHATLEGSQSWPVRMQLLSPWIRCSNLKDSRFLQSPGKLAVEDVPIGDGVVDFATYFALMRELGIGGPQSVHIEYKPFGYGEEDLAGEKRVVCLAAMKKDRATLQAMLQAAGFAG